jgi:histidyl-tRNA synthetase
LIALCIDILRAFGFTAKDFVVRISDREFWTDFLQQQKLPSERWEEVLQTIDKSEREPRDKTAEKLGQLADPVLSILEEGGRSGKLDQLVDDLGARGLAEYVDVDVRVVRGLAYYTGTVFEVFDRAGKLRAIAGGGRYNRLIEQLSDGAVATPALGFAMGDVVLGELIRDRSAAREKMEAAVQSKRKIDIYVVIAKEARRADALAHVQGLRENGYRVDYPLTPTKVAKQFQTAEDLGATLALLYGDEWPNVKMKTLATREEKLIEQMSLLDSIGKLISAPA